MAVGQLRMDGIRHLNKTIHNSLLCYIRISIATLDKVRIGPPQVTSQMYSLEIVVDSQLAHRRTFA